IGTTATGTGIHARADCGRAGVTPAASTTSTPGSAKMLYQGRSVMPLMRQYPMATASPPTAAAGMVDAAPAVRTSRSAPRPNTSAAAATAAAAPHGWDPSSPPTDGYSGSAGPE